MKEIAASKINEISNSTEEIEDIRKELSQLFDENSEIFSILGFDIYGYSKYKKLEQSLIPFIFKEIYNETINNCFNHEQFFFQKYESPAALKKPFIDTGDGGFQLFNNPIEAIIFSFYFQTNLRRFNSFDFYSGIREITGEISLRYALTTDSLFNFANNLYGPAIINNARIMSKDRLNRFIIDGKTIQWFNRNIKGIENLQTMNLKEFSSLSSFSDYCTDSGKFHSQVFPIDNESKRILNLDILKIGEIEAKGDSFSVYSLHSQISIYHTHATGFNRYTVTLGNL